MHVLHISSVSDKTFGLGETWSDRACTYGVECVVGDTTDVEFSVERQVQHAVSAWWLTGLDLILLTISTNHQLALTTQPNNTQQN